MFKRIRITINPGDGTIRCNRRGQDICVVLCDRETEALKYYRQIREGHGADLSLTLLSHAVAYDLTMFPRANTDTIKDNCRIFEKETLRQACEIYSSRTKIGESHE